MRPLGKIPGPAPRALRARYARHCQQLLASWEFNDETINRITGKCFIIIYINNMYLLAVIEIEYTGNTIYKG